MGCHPALSLRRWVGGGEQVEHDCPFFEPSTGQQSDEVAPSETTAYLAPNTAATSANDDASSGESNAATVSEPTDGMTLEPATDSEATGTPDQAPETSSHAAPRERGRSQKEGKAVTDDAQ